MSQTLKKIVWLASYPKSGNTWFRVFIENIISHENTSVSINNLKIVQHASSRGLIDHYAGISSSDLLREEIDKLRPEVYRYMAQESEDIVFMKVHDRWKNIPSKGPLFPGELTKCVLYFIRNPLDVVVSFAYHENTSISKAIKMINDGQTAFCDSLKRPHNQTYQHLSDWSDHVNSWVFESNLPVLVLRYEDMLNNTLDEFQKAIRYVGLNYSLQEITRAINLSRFESLSKQEMEYGFYEKPIKMNKFFRLGRSGDWINHLSMKQSRELVKKHEEIMTYFGYLNRCS